MKQLSTPKFYFISAVVALFGGSFICDILGYQNDPLISRIPPFIFLALIAVGMILSKKRDLSTNQKSPWWKTAIIVFCLLVVIGALCSWSIKIVKWLMLLHL